MKKAAAIKVDSYDYNCNDIEKGVNDALGLLGGMEKFVSSGDRVLIKT